MPKRILLKRPKCAKCRAHLTGRQRKFCARHASRSRANPELKQSRREEVRLAVQDYRRFKPHAREVDRRADLWRRFREGELLPLCFAYLPTQQLFVVSRRTLRVSPVSHETFLRFTPGLSLDPTKGTFAVTAIPPWEVGDLCIICSRSHDAAHIDIFLVPAERVPVADSRAPGAGVEADVVRSAFPHLPAREADANAKPLVPEYFSLECSQCSTVKAFTLGIMIAAVPNKSMPPGAIQRVYSYDSTNRTVLTTDKERPPS